MYDWTPEMPQANANGALEPHYRRATSTACAFLEQVLKDGRPVPWFSGGTYISAKNATAQEMVQVIEAAISVTSSDHHPAGAHHAAIVTFAVRSAHVVRTGGFGQAGWDALMAKLAGAQRGRGAVAPLAPG